MKCCSVYVIGRVPCALGCVHILLTLFCIVHFGLTLGVSSLQILFYITLQGNTQTKMEWEVHSDM